MANTGIGEALLMHTAMGGGNAGIGALSPSAAPAQAPNRPVASALKILTNYFQNRGIPLQQGMAAVQKELDEGLQLLQYKNSILAIKDLGQGVAQIHFFTLDTEAQLKEDIKHFINLMRKAGIHTIYDRDADPVFMQAAQEFGAQPQQSDNQQFKMMATL
jgi:hypothetical protein